MLNATSGVATLFRIKKEGFLPFSLSFYYCIVYHAPTCEASFFSSTRVCMCGVQIHIYVYAHRSKLLREQDRLHGRFFAASRSERIGNRRFERTKNTVCPDVFVKSNLDTAKGHGLYVFIKETIHLTTISLLPLSTDIISSGARLSVFF